MERQEILRSDFPRQLFWFCCLLLTYFIGLLAVNYFKLDFVLIGVLVELVTIPSLLAVLGLTVYNAYSLFREVGTRKRWHLYSLGVLLVTIGLLFVAWT